MNRAKENWIGEQCNEIEENLRKNNSKTAYEILRSLVGSEMCIRDRMDLHWPCGCTAQSSILPIGSVSFAPL